MDGKSLMPLLLQKGEFEREALYWHGPHYLEGSSKTKHPEELIREVWRCVPSGTIRKGDWKLIENFEDNTMELYNLKEDIGELNELSTKNPRKVAELLKDLKEWRASVNAPVPTELNPEYRKGR